MALENFVARRDLAHIDTLAAAIGRKLAPQVLEELGRYVELVATWNQRIDLTAARGPSAQAEVLLADALVIADPAFVPGGARVVDVGSGAGAPAIPLLLLRADLTAVLVESKQKRIAFLNTAIGTLALMNRIKALHLHLDTDTPQVAGQPFDVAISRATFVPEVWLASGLALARMTLLFTASAEPPSPPKDAECIRSFDYRLPISGAPRRVTVWRSSV
jgi:16S rRNA (guanine527-N7)-methyltransferase